MTREKTKRDRQRERGRERKEENESNRLKFDANFLDEINVLISRNDDSSR